MPVARYSSCGGLKTLTARQALTVVTSGHERLCGPSAWRRATQRVVADADHGSSGGAVRRRPRAAGPQGGGPSGPRAARGRHPNPRHCPGPPGTLPGRGRPAVGDQPVERGRRACRDGDHRRGARGAGLADRGGRGPGPRRGHLCGGRVAFAARADGSRGAAAARLGGDLPRGLDPGRPPAPFRGRGGHVRGGCQLLGADLSWRRTPVSPGGAVCGGAGTGWRSRPRA